MLILKHKTEDQLRTLQPNTSYHKTIHQHVTAASSNWKNKKTTSEDSNWVSTHISQHQGNVTIDPNVMMGSSHGQLSAGVLISNQSRTINKMGGKIDKRMRTIMVVVWWVLGWEQGLPCLTTVHPHYLGLKLDFPNLPSSTGLEKHQRMTRYCSTMLDALSCFINASCHWALFWKWAGVFVVLSKHLGPQSSLVREERILTW